MPLKDIVTTIIALRAFTWLFFEAVHLHFSEQRDSLSKPVLKECLENVLEPASSSRIWTPAPCAHENRDIMNITDKLLMQLKDKKISFIPDAAFANKIWEVRGAINAAFAMTFVFLIYSPLFTIVCSSDVCINFPLNLSASEALRYTALLIGLVTFAYALVFTARLNLRQAIMDMTLWKQWRSTILKIPVK